MLNLSAIAFGMGDNSLGALGNIGTDSTYIPLAVPGLPPNLTSIVASDYFSGFLTSSGDIFMTGIQSILHHVMIDQLIFCSFMLILNNN